MKTKKWPIGKIALAGTLAGVVYGLWGEGGGRLLSGEFSVGLAFIVGTAVGGAALAAAIACVRNGFAR